MQLFVGPPRANRYLIVINEDAGLLAWADPLLDITPDVVKTLDLAAK